MCSEDKWFCPNCGFDFRNMYYYDVSDLPEMVCCSRCEKLIKKDDLVEERIDEVSS